MSEPSLPVLGVPVSSSPGPGWWRELWQRPHGQIPALDGLRALAVLLVICSHYTEEFGVRYVPGIDSSPFRKLPMFYWGWTGVDLFFVLSGYLIGRQLWKERLSTGTVNFSRFFLRRGFRIWPLYFAMLAVFAVTGQFRANRYDLLFISNYFSGAFYRGWSLSTEEQFYILVPLLLIAFSRVHRPRTFAITLVVSVVLVELMRWHDVTTLLARGVSGQSIDNKLYNQFHLHCEALVAGLAIALGTVVAPDWFRRHTGPGLSRVGLATFLACSALAATLRLLSPHVFHFLALALVFGSLAFWLLLDRSIVNRIASWGGFLPVSRLSYGMYLNHFYVLPSLTAWSIATMRQQGLPQAAWFPIGLLVGVTISMAAAFITYVGIERPFLNVRDRLLPS